MNHLDTTYRNGRTTHKRNGQHTEHLFMGRFLQSRTTGPVAIRIAEKGVVREEWAAHPFPFEVPGYERPKPVISQGREIHTYLHREDGPALIERLEGEGGKTIETWFRNNEEYHPTAHERMKWEARKAANGGTPFHADTLEALAGRDPSMGALSEEWKEARFYDGARDMVAHRIDGPAYIERDLDNNTITKEIHFIDGQSKNPNGPVEKMFDPNTGICTQEYGDLTPGRPYHIERDAKTGKVVLESWRNRENGPRSVWLNPETNQIEETWPNKRSPHLPGKPTLKQAAAWEALKAQQGGPFTPGLDEVPRAQRPASVKESAAAAAAKATEPKRKPQHQDER